MSPLEQWVRTQTEQGMNLYLILDSDGQLDERNALLAELDNDQYSNLYLGTPADSLALMGPYLISLKSADSPALQTLLQTPERNWGWLASATNNDLEAMTRHWQDRLVIGDRPSQALYRFHDNNVLGRALAFLQPEQRPDYLGPMTSVCYWQVDQWTIAYNPDPDRHPLPPNPAWLNTPIPAGVFAGVQFDNTRRYLMRDHSQSMTQLSKQQDLDTWLRNQLELARTWNWHEPDQIHFLLTQTLQASGYAPPDNWQPTPDETPLMHFNRLYLEKQFWQGEAPV